MLSDPDGFIFIPSLVRYPHSTKKKLLSLFFGENIKLDSFCFDLNNARPPPTPAVIVLFKERLIIVVKTFMADTSLATFEADFLWIS